MTAVDHQLPKPKRPRRLGIHHWLMNKIASPDFQAWAAAFPLTKRAARKDGERLFDLVSGFAYSQVLHAAVELGLLRILQEGPAGSFALSGKLGLSEDRTRALCQATSALGLTERTRDGTYRLARLGAATIGVPGLEAMIKHHSVFYQDLQDPVALLRDETDPQLAKFWPYVRGETAKEVPSDTAQTYSDLMAQTQGLVAQETLRAVDLTGVRHLMDVGGGTGAFLKAVRAQYGDLQLSLFDLPAVVANAKLDGKAIDAKSGSFHEPLPRGPDAISLVRVLYDHSDDTIDSLLSKVYDALPAGGRLIVSEPMAGGETPTRSGDVYFSLYTMAMTTGRARSAAQIQKMILSNGFENIKFFPTDRPFITSCLTAQKPG